MSSMGAQSLRPADFARLILAAELTLPRRRPRDQRADQAGLALKRRLLEALVMRDPDAVDLGSCLCELAEALGPPSGPARAVALAVLQEWQMAEATPQWVAHMRAESQQPSKPEGPRRGRQLPG